MSADDNAPVQAREVEVVARALGPWMSGTYACEHAGPRCPTPDECRDRYHQDQARDVLAALGPIRAGERQEAARAAVAALGLTEETNVDWCHAEDWSDPYRDGSGSWVKCNQTADHPGDHEDVDGHSWPRDLPDPNDQPKPRRRRLVGPWQDAPSADGVTGRTNDNTDHEQQEDA